MVINDLNTKTVGNPAWVALDDGNGDTYKANFPDVVADAAEEAVQDIEISNNTVTFTSSDVVDGSATSWTSVTRMASGEALASLFAKVSQMFKNVRYLWKLLGSTSISSIGNGTVTGALSTLNSNFAYESIRGADVLTLSSAFASASPNDFVIKRVGRIAHITGMIGSLSLQAGRNEIGTLGTGWRPHVFDVYTVGTIGANTVVNTIVRVEINKNGLMTITSDIAIASSLRFGCSYILGI